MHCKRILVTGKSEGVTKVINNNGVPEVYQVILLYFIYENMLYGCCILILNLVERRQPTVGAGKLVLLG